MNARAISRHIARSAALGSATTIGRLVSADTRHDGAMRVLAHVPNYPPGATAGSERSIEAIMCTLAGLGHRTTVLFHGEAVEGTYEGVRVMRESSYATMWRIYREHDVVLTQLGTRNRAMLMARATNRPLVHLLRMGGVDPDAALGVPDLLVYNAEWLRDAHPWPGATTVLHPPVDPDRYRTTADGEAITLLNLNANKGASLFFALAHRLPTRSFLGVRGAYGHQETPVATPPNVAVVDPVSDVREIYSRTRLLLMPSTNESYGRVGLEAAASGIPTVASRAPGIREALGQAGTYLPLDDLDAWIDAIVRFDEPGFYARASQMAIARSREMAPETELAAFEKTLLAVVQRSLGRSNR